MAQVNGMEATEASVAATISTYLTAELDALWAAAGDVATVPKPYTAGTWIPSVQTGDSELSEDFPELQVYCPQARNTENAAANVGGWGGWHYRVIVECYLESDSAGMAFKHAQRFLSALRHVFYKHPGLDGSLAGTPGVTIAGMDIRLAQSENAGLLRIAQMALDVTIDEFNSPY